MLSANYLKDEKSENALLNYSEAYDIFRKFKDEQHKGICLANIGTIMMQKEDYSMAAASFEIACDIQKKLTFGEDFEDSADHLTDDFAINKFILACRQFQKGLANFATFKVDFPNRTLLSKLHENVRAETIEFEFNRVAKEH